MSEINNMTFDANKNSNFFFKIRSQIVSIFMNVNMEQEKVKSFHW